MSNGIRSLPRYRHGGLHTKEENRRRAMAGERGYASIGPTPSWAERVAAQVRSVPRRINRALQPETAGETAALVGASMAEPLGTGIDIADIIAGARTGDIPRMGWGAAGLALPLVAGSALRKIAQRAARAADELPMDEASRMARAEEMGFDTSERFYHKTPADFEEFKLGRSDIDPVTGGEAPELSGRGIWFGTEANRSNLPAAHNTLTGTLGSRRFKPGVRTIPVHLRMNNPLVQEVITLDPQNIRSPWAAFDPAQAESADLLAGIVPLLGLGAAGAARRNYIERERSYE